MSKRIYLLLSLLIVLVIFTIADGINNVNSGIYADAHGLDGASVGWFHPFGVPIFALAFLITLSLGIYISSEAHKK